MGVLETAYETVVADSGHPAAVRPPDASLAGLGDIGPNVDDLTNTTAVAMLAGKDRPTGDSLTAAVLAADDADRAHRLTTLHLALRRDRVRSGSTTIRDATPALLRTIRDTVAQVHSQARSARETLADIDLDVPEQVAQASKAQREAIAEVPDLARRYNRPRLIQALVYQATVIDRPGYTSSDTASGDRWAPVFAQACMSSRASRSAAQDHRSI